MTNYLNRLNNIFHSIIAIPLVSFSFLYLEIDSGDLEPIFGGRSYYVEAAVLFLLSLMFILWLFSKFKRDTGKILGMDEDLKTRLTRFADISIKFFLWMTAPGVIAIILMFFTGEVSFSLIYILELFLLSLKRPSVQNLSNSLNLKGEEREIVIKKRSLGN